MIFFFGAESASFVRNPTVNDDKSPRGNEEGVLNLPPKNNTVIKVIIKLSKCRRTEGGDTQDEPTTAVVTDKIAQKKADDLLHYFNK